MQRHGRKVMSVHEEYRIEIGVDVQRIAGHCREIDLAREHVKHSTSIREQSAYAAEIASRIASIEFGFYPVVVPHDPRTDHPAVIGYKQAAREPGQPSVAVDSVLPVQQIPPQQSFCAERDASTDSYKVLKYSA